MAAGAGCSGGSKKCGGNATGVWGGGCEEGVASSVKVPAPGMVAGLSVVCGGEGGGTPA